MPETQKAMAIGMIWLPFTFYIIIKILFAQELVVNYKLRYNSLILKI